MKVKGNGVISPEGKLGVGLLFRLSANCMAAQMSAISSTDKVVGSAGNVNDIKPLIVQTTTVSPLALMLNAGLVQKLSQGAISMAIISSQRVVVFCALFDVKWCAS